MAETQKLHITFSLIAAAVGCNRIQRLGVKTLVKMQRDVEKTEHHLKSSAKNMQIQIPDFSHSKLGT